MPEVMADSFGGWDYPPGCHMSDKPRVPGEPEPLSETVRRAHDESEARRLRMSLEDYQKLSPERQEALSHVSMAPEPITPLHGSGGWPDISQLIHSIPDNSPSRGDETPRSGQPQLDTGTELGKSTPNPPVSREAQRLPPPAKPRAPAIQPPTIPKKYHRTKTVRCLRFVCLRLSYLGCRQGKHFTEASRLQPEWLLSW
jgi:hypothetical protein